MRGRTHAVAAATLGLGLSIVLRGSESNAWLAGSAVALVGGLLPDIDEPNSTIGFAPRTVARSFSQGTKRGNPIRLALLVTGEILTGIVKALATLIRELTGHRGATHWLVTALFLSAPVIVLLDDSLGLCFGVGYLSHIALDMMTKSGVPVLGPFSDTRLHLLPRPMCVKTGGPLDHFLQYSLMVMYVLLLVVGGVGTWSNVP